MGSGREYYVVAQYIQDWRHPDMMSASEGRRGHGKADVVRGVARIFFTTNLFQMRPRGRESENPKIM